MMHAARTALVSAALLPLLAAVACGQEEGQSMSPDVPPVPYITDARGSVGEGVPAFVVRPGYRVELAADDLGEARFMEFDDAGTLYLSQPRAGKIVTLKANDDGTFGEPVDFVTDQSNAHSMDWHDGWLYYTSSAEGYCRRARDTNGDGKADEVEDVITEGIPEGGGHPFRGVLVTDDHIYITVSDPQNMTAELDSDRKTLYRFDRDGSNRAAFATGIRNTEKIRHRIGKDGKVTEEIWGADHGSDWFGREYGDRQGEQPITDLMPPDELNHLEEGKFYGHPYLMADRTPRPEFTDRDDLHELAMKTVPAAWSFGAHTACNGFTFLSGKAGEQFGEDHTGDLFQAQHGSWNSSVPVGYAVTRVLFDPMTGRPYGELTIVDTHEGGETLARPVDCVEAPDGSILFSCDQTRRIYRILADEGEQAAAE